MDLLTIARSPRAKMVPVLALAVPVTVTVVLWLFARGDPTAVLAVGAPHGDPSAPTVTRGTGAGPSTSVAAAFDERVATFEAHVGSAPENRELRLALARLLHDGHQEREAIQHYRAALVLDPDDARVYFDLASAYGALGEWDQAETVLMARLEAAPYDAVAMYDLGAIKANGGDPEEAERWWREAQKAATDDELTASVAHALARLQETETP